MNTFDFQQEPQSPTGNNSEFKAKTVGDNYLKFHGFYHKAALQM
jgi:hypothetical protein